MTLAGQVKKVNTLAPKVAQVTKRRITCEELYVRLISDLSCYA